jgi:hypothetical protein
MLIAVLVPIPQDLVLDEENFPSLSAASSPAPSPAKSKRPASAAAAQLLHRPVSPDTPLQTGPGLSHGTGAESATATCSGADSRGTSERASSVADEPPGAEDELAAAEQTAAVAVTGGDTGQAEHAGVNVPHGIPAGPAETQQDADDAPDAPAGKAESQDVGEKVAGAANSAAEAVAEGNLQEEVMPADEVMVDQQSVAPTATANAATAQVQDPAAAPAQVAKEKNPAAVTKAVEIEQAPEGVSENSNAPAESGQLPAASAEAEAEKKPVWVPAPPPQVPAWGRKERPAFLQAARGDETDVAAAAKKPLVAAAAAPAAIHKRAVPISQVPAPPDTQGPHPPV